MRRTLVVLVLALAAVGAGCSSSPQQPNPAVVAARQNLEHWASVVNADAKAEAQCKGSGCGVDDYALIEKTCLDEQRTDEATKALERAEGQPAGGRIPVCPPK